MISCPQCQAEVADDIGLLTCGSCGHQFMAGPDGQALSPPNPPVMEEPPSLDFPKDLEPQEEAAASPDMTELADFGNAPMATNQGGALRFHLFIRGIDTQEIRSEVAAALSDEKFLWDISLRLQDMKDGELQLRGLTAVKAALAVQRLRSVSVEVQWFQQSIHQDGYEI